MLIPQSKIFKPFNLKGKLKIKYQTGTGADALFNGFWLPAILVGDYKYHILVKILPHYNPNRNMGEAKSYLRGINKTSIFFGEVLVKEDN